METNFNAHFCHLDGDGANKRIVREFMWKLLLFSRFIIHRPVGLYLGRYQIKQTSD